VEDSQRIQELERRVQQDPASIAFAQLADEYRRAGMYDKAVRVARAGLARHPGYLSARVTFGRALVELGQLDAAQKELDTALKSALENLAAIRALADIHQRRGDLPDPPPTPPDAPCPAPVPDIAVEAPPPDSAVPDALPDVLGALPEPREPEQSLDLDLREFNSALEALDALTFDLPDGEPPAPQPAPEAFDLAAFRMDARADLEPVADWNLDALTMPAPNEAASDIEPETPLLQGQLDEAAAHIDIEEPVAHGEPDPPARVQADPPVPDVEPEPLVVDLPRDPALEELESWLVALAAERTARQRGDRP
jgi:tetratricopeptide (TPR) repeat protein